MVHLHYVIKHLIGASKKGQKIPCKKEMLNIKKRNIHIFLSF